MIFPFPVSFGKEKYCDTYRFDFEKRFEDIVLELARKIVFWNTTTSHHVAFRVMMQLMGTEIDRRVDYTYDDIHRIVEKNWSELVKTSIVHKI